MLCYIFFNLLYKFYFNKLEFLTYEKYIQNFYPKNKFSWLKKKHCKKKKYIKNLLLKEIGFHDEESLLYKNKTCFTKQNWFFTTKKGHCIKNKIYTDVLPKEIGFSWLRNLIV